MKTLTVVCNSLNLAPSIKNICEAENLYDRLVDNINENDQNDKAIFRPTVPSKQEFSDEMGRGLELLDYLTLEQEEKRELPHIEFETELFVGQAFSDILNISGLPIENYANGFMHKFFIN